MDWDLLDVARLAFPPPTSDDMVEAMANYLGLVEALFYSAPRYASISPAQTAEEAQKIQEMQGNLNIYGPKFRKSKQIIQQLLFHLSWQRCLCKEDACFLYLGDEASAKLFKDKMGVTPQAFALNALPKGNLAMEIMLEQFPKHEIFDIMLDRWASIMQTYKSSSFTNPRKARADFQLKTSSLQSFGELIYRQPQVSANRTTLGTKLIDFGPQCHPCSQIVSPELIRYADPADSVIYPHHGPTTWCHHSDCDWDLNREQRKKYNIWVKLAAQAPSDYKLLIAADILRESGSLVEPFIPADIAAVQPDLLSVFASLNNNA